MREERLRHELEMIIEGMTMIYENFIILDHILYLSDQTFILKRSP